MILGILVFRCYRTDLWHLSWWEIGKCWNEEVLFDCFLYKIELESIVVTSFVILVFASLSTRISGFSEHGIHFLLDDKMLMKFVKVFSFCWMYSLTNSGMSGYWYWPWFNLLFIFFLYSCNSWTSFCGTLASRIWYYFDSVPIFSISWTVNWSLGRIVLDV